MALPVTIEPPLLDEMVDYIQGSSWLCASELEPLVGDSWLSLYTTSKARVSLWVSFSTSTYSRTHAPPLSPVHREWDHPIA
jgi:hypothetical protein